MSYFVKNGIVNIMEKFIKRYFGKLIVFMLIGIRYSFIYRVCVFVNYFFIFKKILFDLFLLLKIVGIFIYKMKVLKC